MRISTVFLISGVNYAYHSYKKPLRTANSKKPEGHLTPIYIFLDPDISTKIDAQDNGYKADGVLELFERPRQIPLFLLEVSEGPNNPDPDKISGDRKKLMNEGVFALNKFMMSTELLELKVCETLGVFLAQGFGKIF